MRLQFRADGPNKVWLTDITEHRRRKGKLYVCAVKDVWCNGIVGYSICDRMESAIAVNALESAGAQGRNGRRLCGPRIDRRTG